MEALSRDSAPEAAVDAGPKSRLVPLESVNFTSMVPVAGMGSMISCAETGGHRVDKGKDFQFPQIFLDPVLRLIVIGDSQYPLERVVCFKRAKAALSKLPKIPAQPDFTIGKRKSKDI